MGTDRNFVQTGNYMQRPLLNMILLLACLWSLSAHADDVKFTNGQLQLNGALSDGKPVQVVISTLKVSDAFPYKNVTVWGGDQMFPAKVLISSFEVRVDGKVIPVSFSAYADLGRPGTGSISNTKNGFTITLTGGDAGVGYRAIFTFENLDGYMVLHQRKVMGLEFPGQRWEETAYSYVTQTN